MQLSADKVKSKLMARVEEISGEKVLGCYQCGKCSAGCPMAEVMEYLPHRLLRLLQLGDEEAALASRIIWLCAACHTCASRCPRSVDLSRIMEALRMVLLREGNRFVDPASLPHKLLDEVPPQALVGGFRKFR
ncbi:heterodisulfide reductase subunit C2 [Candidatus Hakubella thermalkaliphila]|uniref:Heterodisulfide reductase subunit C2 n=1 Tax=Candidatus Hakubella thermalkaliphila TaxID=2754717 RepID=A0A6V8PQU6_9ACTN|nr:4Fe-4S dicluster domain-containing protein [Candidatus Hakubella thermalkaliphila]GFP34627.1 heterodisulfide reductase subunit C2 [Candidatus Hakubella thermalkaliphila]